MCALTFVPHTDGSITVTHNRDEHYTRPEAIAPQWNGHAWYPTDPQGGGTWFAQHPDWVCCLLNGGFETHTRQLPYRKSRGSVIPSFLDYLSLHRFELNFDPTGIEPFTLVLVGLQDRTLCQFVWDGLVLHKQVFPFGEARIWSSATLYAAEVRQARVLQFAEFNKNSPQASQIIAYHRRFVAGQPDQSLAVDLPNGISTVAITQVSGRWGQIEHYYCPIPQYSLSSKAFTCESSLLATA